MFGITTKVSQKVTRYSTQLQQAQVDDKHETLTVKNEIFLWGMKTFETTVRKNCLA